jgi:hypothetical protein
MEAICSSETSVDSQRTTWRYIQEYGTLHNHRCENLKPYTAFFLLGGLFIDAVLSRLYTADDNMINGYGAVGERKIGKGSQSMMRKSTQVPHCSLEIRI